MRSGGVGSWVHQVSAHKQTVLDRVTTEHPQTWWVLVGDDADDDPDIYRRHARRFLGKVAAIAVRRVSEPAADRSAGSGVDGGRRRARPDGGQRSGAGIPAAGRPAADPFGGRGRRPVVPHTTGARQRRYDPARLDRGQRRCAHWWTAPPASLPSPRGWRTPDPVTWWRSRWRADADERLIPGGPTVGEALTGASRRGAAVRGLVWRSRGRWLGFSAPENRALADRVDAAGGAVVLDQRVRATGSHHQKLVVGRRAGRRGVRRRHRPGALPAG
jgi:hypothetical protein